MSAAPGLFNLQNTQAGGKQAQTQLARKVGSILSQMRETMKKILLAATTLALTSGAAAAQDTLRFSGNARFGVEFDSEGPTEPVDDRWRLHNRFRLQVDAIRALDTGLEFGARLRFQGAADLRGNQPRYFARAEGLEVAFGNIFGAVDSLPNLYQRRVPSAGIGLTGNGFHNVAANTASNAGFFAWTSYASGAAPLADTTQNGIEAIYRFGDFTIHAHLTDDRRVADGVRTGSGSQAISVYGTFGDISLGVGYEQWRRGTRDGDSVLVATAGMDLGEGNVALSYARTNLRTIRASFDAPRVEANKWSLQGGWNLIPDLYTYGFVAHENNDIGLTYGLGASFSLGAGASLEAGWTRGRTATFNAAGERTGQFSRDLFTAGVFFTF